MAMLRKFLGHAFEVLALVLLISCAGVVVAVVAAFRKGLLGPRLHQAGPTGALADGIAVSAVIAWFLIPLALCLCYGMAALKIRRGSPSARPWAIGASIVLLLQSFPLAAAAYVVIHRYSFLHARSLILLTLLSVALGVAGLVAFSPRDSAISAPRKKPQRIPGDGTSAWADSASWIVAVVGYFAVRFWLDHWAQAQGLRDTRIFPQPLVELTIALLITTTLHEAGHALAGLMLGMKLRLFAVGPFQWKVQDGRWRFTFDPKKTFSGATACVPAKPASAIVDELLLIAAGPAASLVTGVTAAALLMGCKGTSFEPQWNFFAILTSLSLVGTLVNLLPLQPDAIYSDGAQIYHLIKGGPWADLHRVQTMVASSLATPLRPRDWKLKAIRKAEASFREGRQAMFLRLWESSYFLDQADVDEARAAFIEAERLYRSSENTLPAALIPSFVYRSALLCRDAQSVRQWGDKLQAAKGVPKGLNYWLAMSALRWVEGNLEEARTLLYRAEALASALPEVGDSEFDRYRCELLGREIAVAEHARKQLPAPVAQSALDTQSAPDLQPALVTEPAPESDLELTDLEMLPIYSLAD
jgi:hypothetical protein